MFSKKMALIFVLIVLIIINIIGLSVTSKRYSTLGFGRVAISFVAPFQELITRSIRLLRGTWEQYFYLVSVAQENKKLKNMLHHAIEQNNQWRETELANARLRRLLNFKKTIINQVAAAEVIGKDPSAWFKTVTIDKGRADGLTKGLPVVVAQGIVGQVIEVANHYAKVMLIIDHNSAVDALVQRTRARGIIKGASTDTCVLEYVLSKHDVRIGDTVVSSGLDGVYPKGLRIGEVSNIIQRNPDIFQKVTITPYVDFEKLEEVLIILSSQEHEFVSQQ